MKDKQIFRKIDVEQPKLKHVKVAGGQIVEVTAQIRVTFKLAHVLFAESFIVLPKSNSIILGNEFFKKHDINICPKRSVLHFPDLTVSISEIIPHKEPRRAIRAKIPVYATKKQTIPANKTVIIECSLSKHTEDLKFSSGVVEPCETFERETDLALTLSLSTIGENNTIFIAALNITDHPITLTKRTELARFQIFTSEQADKLIQVDPELIALAKYRNSENFIPEFNQLIQDSDRKGRNQPPRPKPDYDSLWFPTPETCGNPSSVPPPQKQIHDRIEMLQQKESIDPKHNYDDREKFLSQFTWTRSLLPSDQKQQVVNLLVEYNDIFTKHRFDVGYNTEMKIKLTPEHSMPMYVQGPPTPFHLRDEIHEQIALMHYYGLITTLPQSKYSSPLFAHKKESGRLRLLIDLRRVNHLLKNDYLNANEPFSSMTDATNHFAGKTFFTKLDCSQAYHCVQMADDISVQLLAFNFSSRTYAYKCLAQGLSKSVTGFSSFIRHYLDPCLAADMCTQFMDDIGFGVKTFEDLVSTLKQVFDCIRRSGLNLSPQKCEIATESIKFLVNVITKEGISPESVKIKKFLNNVRLAKSTKAVKRLIGIVQFFRNYIPKLGEKLIPFYRMLKKDATLEPDESHVKALATLKDLLKAKTMTLRLAKPGQKYILLCDASYYAAGFVLMVEDYLDENNTKEPKKYAPVSFGSQAFKTPQLKYSIYYKEFLALYFALEHFAHFIWGSFNPVVVLTDNRSLTQFFQSKTIPPSLWNCLDRVLSSNLVIAHIPGKANYAADFFSRVEIDRAATVSLKLNEKIPVRDI